MSDWETFEEKCCSYLNDSYGNDHVRFEVDGGRNSTSSDIKVYVKEINRFNIEVKSSVAQSGQFVVLNKDGKLIFSPRNKSDENEAKPFLDYMNDNYDLYKTPTTAGEELDMDSNEYNKWIIEHYHKKNEKFVITSDSFSFIIFPIEKYGDYFETKCTYRIKGSGSGKVAKKDANIVQLAFNGTSYRYESKGKDKNHYYYLQGTSGYKCGDSKIIGSYGYYVSRILDSGEILITRKSNTRNANVIFSVKNKKGQAIEDIEVFKEALK